ncbi:uncharacterized protein TNIN_394461 [Trichonephila inaurata madagascariensis]|uniref:Ionotropic glutamate receptor C-terminal domain-containing protein n=1 Tax=Trichonephila inaurata madagascariensis TaxID=2747483 RepID=A0A8X6MGF8_9ARAC|nr:uncharacterized protein TNIN_394461 [Trichonephila inaurata madagascariensis]
MTMAAWWLTCMLLTGFYTANLTAFMTTVSPIMHHTIEKFILSNKKWMFKKGTAFSDDLLKEGITADAKEFLLLKKSFASGIGKMIEKEEEVIDLVRKGYDYIQEVNVLNYMLFKDFMDTNGYCQFSVLDLHFFEHTTAFAFPKGSPYAPSFSE